MNTTQLECFLAVAEYMNFSKAAESINITQPAVSHQINSLEDELGVKLFVRTSKSVRLTPEGAQFINDADTILKISMDAKRKLVSGNKDNRVRIGIGCHSSLELEMVGAVISCLREFYPDIYPDIHNIPFKSMDNLLADDTIQLMFSIKSPDGKGAASYKELSECKLCCLCRHDNPFAGRTSLKLSDLKGKVVLNKRAKSHESLFKYQSIIASNNLSSDIIFADGVESCYALVKAGCGFSISPILPNISDDGLAYIPITDVEPVSFGIYHRQTTDNPLLKKFLEIAEEMYGDDQEKKN